MSSSKLILPPIQRNPAKIKWFELCEKGGDIEAFKEMLEHPYSFQMLNDVNEEGLTPLMICAFKGHLSFVEEIIKVSTKATLKSSRLNHDIYQGSPSGATALDFANGAGHTKIAEVLSGEIQRRHRLKTMETKEGYHETSVEAFHFIAADAAKEKHPMIGGVSGYFGGGIYFAINPQEASRKALAIGFGFKCLLRLGNCFKIHHLEDLQNFYTQFYPEVDYHPNYLYVLPIPVDVMRGRLLEKGYDSVWAKNSIDMYENTFTGRRQGEEYSLYSADQVSIQTYYKTHLNTFNIQYLNYTFKMKLSIPRDFQSRNIEWTPIEHPIHIKPNQMPIKPTRPANYYTIQVNPAIYAPWTIEKTRPFLGIVKGSPNDFQSGDIVVFSGDTPSKHVSRWIKGCLYLNYGDYETWEPFAKFNENKYTYNCIHVERTYHRLFLGSKLLKTLPFLTSAEKLFKHYKDILMFYPNTFIVQNTDLGETDWPTVFPILTDDSAYQIKWNVLKDKMCLAQDESHHYLMVQNKDDIDGFKLLSRFQIPIDDATQRNILDGIYV